MDKGDDSSVGISTFQSPKTDTDLDLDDGSLEADIERYATMPLSQVVSELGSHGIDPANTVTEVRRLVGKSRRRPATV